MPTYVASYNVLLLFIVYHFHCLYYWGWNDRLLSLCPFFGYLRLTARLGLKLFWLRHMFATRVPCWIPHLVVHMRYGLEIIYYRTPYLWASLPEQCKHQNSVGKFKEKIKNWTYRDMYLPIVPHLWTKFRFYLIFSNYFYPKLNFIQLKKQTNKKRNESIIFTFCFFLFVFFSIVFILVFQFANVDYFISLLSLLFLWR